MSSLITRGNAAGTGSVTLESPNTNSDFTISLPATTGTVVLTGTTPSLNGITFPATQSPSADANTLDDYEEGTWTPTLRNATTTTYTTQNGRYTKIGRIVYIQLNLRINSIGNGDTRQIAGLPFTASGVTNNEACVAIANFEQIATNIVSIYGGIFDTFINITSLTAAGSVPGSSAIFKNSAIIELGGWYIASS